jgi:hypothetical protein
MKGNGPTTETTARQDAAKAKPSIPPPDEPNDLDKYARFIASDAVVATKGAVAVCSWGPPPKSSFIRTHPSPEFYVHLHVLVLESEGKRRTYLLDPRLLVLPELEGYPKIQRTTPWISEHGAIGIWPISVELDDNPWVRSALNVTSEAQTRWLAAIAVKKLVVWTIQKIPLAPVLL